MKKARKNSNQQQYEGLSKTRNSKRQSQAELNLTASFSNPKRLANTNGGFGINSFGPG